jgi:hypothetical protein
MAIFPGSMIRIPKRPAVEKYRPFGLRGRQQIVEVALGNPKLDIGFDSHFVLRISDLKCKMNKKGRIKKREKPCGLRIFKHTGI